jgi:YegS/Rv2252/BmrU family lipid kinase
VGYRVILPGESRRGPARQVLILANPHAGPASGRRRVRACAAALRRRGLEAVVCWRPEELTRRLEHAGDGCRCVVSAGGDGTLGEVLNRAPDTAVAVLPLGNENLVAGHFGCPRHGLRLADLITDGSPRSLDLAQANGRRFVLMAGAGFDAEVVRLVHQRRDHVSKLSYLFPLVRAARTYRYPPIRVDIDETGETLEGAHVLLFNLPRYGLGLPLAADANPTDGLLNLCVFQRPGLGRLLGYLWTVVRHRQAQCPDIQRRLVRRVRLSSPGHVALQLDGDPAGELPARVEVLPRALSLLVPEAADSPSRRTLG